MGSQGGAPAIKRLYYRYLADRNYEVKLIRQDDSGQQHDKTNNGSILKVRELHFTRPKLNTPADSRVRWRWLEPHRLPIGRLNVLVKT